MKLFPVYGINLVPLYVLLVAEMVHSFALKAQSRYDHNFFLKSRNFGQKGNSPLTMSSNAGGTLWWTEGLKFGCTACGRCCQNKGEVWLNGDEFADLALYISESPLQLLERYSEKVTSGWVKVKTEVNHDPLISSQCIFLGDDGKQCSIYDARPTQCRTYPFWPSLLSNRESWRNESVQSVESRRDGDLLLKQYDRISSEERHSGRDDCSSKESTDERFEDLPIEKSATKLAIDEDGGVAALYWTAGTGGCEGVEDINAHLIDSSVVHNNLELYNAYTKSFPFRDVGNDSQKLLVRTATVIDVIKSCRSWMESSLSLPNITAMIGTGRIKNRVCLSDDGRVIIEQLRYEILDLKTTGQGSGSGPENSPSTVLVIPNAFRSLKDFKEYSRNILENILPLIERSLSLSERDRYIDYNPVPSKHISIPIPSPSSSSTSPSAVRLGVTSISWRDVTAAAASTMTTVTTADHPPIRDSSSSPPFPDLPLPPVPRPPQAQLSEGPVLPTRAVSQYALDSSAGSKVLISSQPESRSASPLPTAAKLLFFHPSASSDGLLTALHMGVEWEKGQSVPYPFILIQMG